MVTGHTKGGEVGMIQIDIPTPKNCYDCPCSTFDDVMDEVECNIVNDAWFIPEETAKKED